MTLRLDPEEALLVAAAAPAPPEGPSPRRPDWARLIELGAWHRMLPLLWHHLEAREARLAVPDEVAAALKQAAREATARALNLAIERDRALQLLAHEDVPVVLLKGAALVDHVYEHPGLRPMVDLDLLVPRADVQRAHDALQALGYTVRGARLSRDDDWQLAERHHHLPLVKTGGSVMVELHHQLLVDRPALDVEGVWRRAGPSPHVPSALVPAPEDLFLHVAAHYALDRMNRSQSSLGQVADIARIARHWDLDWSALVERAREERLADRLFLALASSALLVGEVAPPAVVRALAPRSYTARRGERFVQDRVLSMAASFPLEQLALGRRRLLPGDEALELYLRPDEDSPPSRARLKIRRWAHIARRVGGALAHPGALLRDARLSYWITSLRD